MAAAVVVIVREVTGETLPLLVKLALVGAAVVTEVVPSCTSPYPAVVAVAAVAVVGTELPLLVEVRTVRFPGMGRLLFRCWTLLFGQTNKVVVAVVPLSLVTM